MIKVPIVDQTCMTVRLSMKRTQSRQLFIFMISVPIVEETGKVVKISAKRAVETVTCIFCGQCFCRGGDGSGSNNISDKPME